MATWAGVPGEWGLGYLVRGAKEPGEVVRVPECLVRRVRVTGKLVREQCGCGGVGRGVVELGEGVVWLGVVVLSERHAVWVMFMRA